MASSSFPSSLKSEIDQAVQASINEFVEKRNSGLPRAAILATTSKDEILVNSTAGFVKGGDDLDSASKITDETLFPLWSSTKLVTAIAALTLIDQGKIGLKDDASKYVKELKNLKVLKGFGEDGEPEYEENTRVCTIENLITHTAGSSILKSPFLSPIRRADVLLSHWIGFRYPDEPIYEKIQAKLGLTSIYDENSVRESLTKSPFLM